MTTSKPIDEFGLGLIHALQLRPRAEWAELARPLGVSAATVAKHWKSLRERGLAWVGVGPGRNLLRDGGVGFVLLRCRAGDQEALARRLIDEPTVATLDTTMGSTHLLLDVLTPDISHLREYVGERLPGLPGVEQVTSMVNTSVYAGGTRWRVGSLDSEQVTRLSAPTSERVGRAERHRLDGLDRRIIGELTLDGRISLAQLAVRCGTTAPTAKRRIGWLVASQTISLRCEMATQMARPMISVTYLFRVPTAQLDRVGDFLTSLGSCRLAAAVTGSYNLLSTMWLANVAEIRQLENLVVNQFPDVIVGETIVHIASRKRIGHVLDHDNRSVGIVPLAAWDASGVTKSRRVAVAGQPD
ncbi:Lrp/AsnC family transcriptional regulator [Janibacter cremeus]|uniref:DNA-binding Lrp family transcriptional regulator n=1 Tax=Janibacter cremeus TaxID=1285192 RepID=A0A852VW96_9MICO|nr:AsnC family transcriptional regulator [Janibacter cremeus]NYF98045.1 DNA-binding Lrp family transcriptional regulator [Janibacter cremeus]